jgi:DNA-binding winged helix-turn-helix (wHTH) protein/TolB-like protein
LAAEEKVIFFRCLDCAKQNSGLTLDAALCLGDKLCLSERRGDGMTPRPESPAPFRLRDQIVTPQRNSISASEGGGEISVEPKIMAVLCVLAGEPGRVFTRAELIDQVWGTEYGADESLTRAISHLRKALGDTRAEPAVIETISKRGYRLLPSAAQSLAGPVAQAEAPPGRRAVLVAIGATAAAGLGFLLQRRFFHDRAPASDIAVIVLPFNPVRREPADTSLAAALTVDLVGALARDKRLHVTVKRPDPAGPARRYSIYADIQTQNGQAYNGKVKAMVEIMDPDTDQALWSRRYEQAYDGSLKAQDLLSAAIARDLGAALPTMRKKN